MGVMAESGIGSDMDRGAPMGGEGVFYELDTLFTICK
jgi:hypothetical protein